MRPPSENSPAASLRERFIDNAHYGNGTGCRCCDLVDEGHLAALLGVLQVIADDTYVGNYDDGEVVVIYRKWAQNALNGGPYAKP